MPRMRHADSEYRRRPALELFLSAMPTLATPTGCPHYFMSAQDGWNHDGAKRKLEPDDIFSETMIRRRL